MPCPHAGSGTGGLPEPLTRRNFAKAALAIGGSSALSACLDRSGPIETPTGTPPSDRPERQFAWNADLPRGPHGNPRIPGHQLLLLLDLTRDGRPTPEERERVAAALRTLDRAFPWGAGDARDPSTVTGLLSLVGYSPRYFDRFAESIPDPIDLRPPEAVLDELDESPDAATNPDAVLLLTSDDVRVLLSAEAALRGDLGTVNGVDATSFGDVVAVRERRTGFLGVGRPAEQFDAPVPEDSPTGMGFRSSFADNQASEDRVAIGTRPFVGGTTMQLSRLHLDLDGWYAYDREDRIDRMFAPSVDPDDVGAVGEFLAGSSGTDPATVEGAERHAAETGVVGHAQKTAAARDEGFEPLLLRRSEGVSTDLPEPAMNFLSLQRELGDFVATRKAMNGAHLDTAVAAENDGIREFVDVGSRATFLVPPRSRIALPTPDE